MWAEFFTPWNTVKSLAFKQPVNRNISKLLKGVFVRSQMAPRKIAPMLGQTTVSRRHIETEAWLGRLLLQDKEPSRVPIAPLFGAADLLFG